MQYRSVDQLQNMLANEVFSDRTDKKKAAGRALGTFIETITFYLLKSWELENSIAIEKPLAEYANPDITHNVEYSLHPILRQHELTFTGRLPITPDRIFRTIDNIIFSVNGFEKSKKQLLSSDSILRNSCIIASRAEPYKSHLVANLLSNLPNNYQIIILEQYTKPYAMFECKRVGVEEGTKKGPQTIEKAKQGAYVAKMVSSLHKIRIPSGELHGLIYKSDNEICTKPYIELIAEIIESEEPELLRDFILTVGVVSNHGNWFTSNNQNKELRVLAQSYDWLIFLTDDGLSEFITNLLLNSGSNLEPVKEAFLASYTTDENNQFTKVQMNYNADRVLQSYFRNNLRQVESWFNIITPRDWSINQLKSQIFELRNKNWREIHSL